METKPKNLSESKGWKSLIEIPKTFLSTRFLDGDFGEEVLREYKGKVRIDYEDNIVLDVLSYYHYNDRIVRGSNSFAVILVNQILPEGMRVATPVDLERILRNESLDLKGNYEVSALVLMSGDNQNAYLAKYLDKQIQTRGKIEYPIMVPLASLELINDPNSNYGLAFKLKEDAQILYAPQLAYKNHKRRYSKTDEQGLPIFDGNGERTLHTKRCNLSELFLSRDLNLCINWDDLDCGSDFINSDPDSYNIRRSDPDGRVVVLRGEATAPEEEKKN